MDTEKEYTKTYNSDKNKMTAPEFKAAVGMSREWDAYGAGVEVAQDTLQKLGDKPDFWVWNVLPLGTPP